MRECDIGGCNELHFGRGWCQFHYNRWYATGDPLTPLKFKRVSGPPELRFFAKVDASADCWEWTAAKNDKGYGNFAISSDRVVAAHRWVWEHLVGPIPDGLTIDHLCKNRGCVNPDHLEPVTHAENVARGNPGRYQRDDVCKRGHSLLDEDNVYRRPDAPQRRACRMCRRLRGRQWERDFAEANGHWR